jgi:CheY-like chemotaxis protein
LVLLDVSLPSLDGIEVARRILSLDPTAKILFLSETRSWDIAEAAMGTGARGYVIKSDVGRELLPAMDRIIEGKRFISQKLGGQVLAGAELWAVQPETRRHEAAFYSEEASVLDDYASFVETALKAGDSCIAILIPFRQKHLHRRLQARGVNVQLAIEEGRYLVVDVAAALSNILVDGFPDETQFWKTGTSLMMRAARVSKRAHPRIAACGECAPSLLKAGDAEAAIRLEHLWDELGQTFNLYTFCPYLLTPPFDDQESEVIQRICAEHSVVHMP